MVKTTNEATLMTAPIMNPQPSTNTIRGAKKIITTIVAITPIAPAQPGPSFVRFFGCGASRSGGDCLGVGGAGAGGGYHLASDAFHQPGPGQLSLMVRPGWAS